jgi:signal peptidase I
MTMQSILGNFALILLLLTLGTGLIWLYDRFHYAPKRRRIAESTLAEFDARQAKLAETGVKPDLNARAQLAERLHQQPTWIAYTGSFFPVIAAVFLFRSFMFEPFKIPSSSMLPTLQIGDLILVNKFHYGVRLPVINKKIIDNNPVARGDVMVFRYPVDPRQDYIKRVVGLPGDEVSYVNQKLSVNGQLVETKALAEFYDEDSLRYAPQFSEKLGEVSHGILVEPQRQAYYGPDPKRFPMAENCRYTAEGVTCKVPAGHYFLMGDNRDNSQDSRFWGFVPDQNIVGKAFFVWMNFGNLGRIGPFH